MAPDCCLVRASTGVAILLLLLLLSLDASALMDTVHHRPWDATVVAIDIGNTNSCVAGYADGRAQTMFQLCIPSWVAFTGNGTLLVGDDARNHAAVNPGSAIFGFKRLLGKRWNHWYDTEVVQRVIKTVPYKLVEKNSNPLIQVKPNGGVAKEYGAEQITAMIIAKLREAAEAYIGRDVRYAIFTVPQHYNQAPTESTRYAGQIAGVRATRMLDEPIAAAVAYGLHQKLREEGNALVLHVGGGTAEASVLTLVDGVFQFYSARHDPFLGGADFDQRIVDHFVELIKQKHGKDITNDKKAHGKLRTACEQAKKVLSTRRHAQLAIESLVDGLDFMETLTRAKFEELNHDLFLKVIALLDRVMVEAELEKKRNMVDEILLIGGSTMIPKIQRLVRDYFDGKEVNASLKPDEVVSLGAALLTHPSADR
ncbi:hypothetical protein QYE76_016530 [Lolium multiflorum]|uniref:Luminal-binding protein 5 n=1 Tax=Lolium multiflorum TaxID=4521 RepID=A0AAD8QHV8_LOLMU|nr:hypothetical protein QYE76_016530 [Lolium multiflorum]